MGIIEYFILFGTGILSGALNTLVGGGSAVSLPLLVSLGIPARIANGTNRFYILSAALASMTTYHQQGAIPWRHVWRLSIPLLIGTGVGTGIATVVRSRVMDWGIVFGEILALIMILTSSKQLLGPEEHHEIKPLDWKQVVALFLVGIWTGFLVINSASYMILALVLVVGYDLTKALAVKSVFSLLSAILSLLIFSFDAEVNWIAALLLAGGGMVGGWAGARIALLPWAKVWVYRLLVIIVVASIIQLVWRSIS